MTQTEEVLTRALEHVNALASDIAGNLLSGNDIRAAAYLKALHATLRAGAAVVDAKSVPLAEQQFDKRLKEIDAQLRTELAKAPFDNAKTGATAARFDVAGYTLRDITGRPGLTAEELGLSPELHAQIEALANKR